MSTTPEDAALFFLVAEKYHQLRLQGIEPDVVFVAPGALARDGVELAAVNPMRVVRTPLMEAGTACVGVIHRASLRLTDLLRVEEKLFAATGPKCFECRGEEDRKK